MEARLVIVMRLLLAAAAALLASCASPAPAPGASSRALAMSSAPPNIVVVLLDDAHEGQVLTKFPKTKTALAAHGMNTLAFRRAHCTTPLCSPARATLLTGRFPFETGVHHNDDWSGGLGGARAFSDSGADQDTIATRLQAAGYDTALIGKYLNNYAWNGPQPGPPGWDYARVLATGSGYFNYTLVFETGATQYRGSAEADYSTDVFRARAVNAVDDSTSDPFFLLVAPFAPHEPATFASRHLSLYPTQLAPRPPSYANEAARIGKPDWVQALDWTGAEEAEADDLWRREARSLAAVDELVVALVEAVATAGKLDATLFVVLSDNGFSHGEHFWKGKLSAYRASVATPMVFAGRPAVLPSSGERWQLVGDVDLAPTLLDLAGVDSGGMSGVSFAALLESDGAWPREDLFLERRSPSADGSPIPERPIPSWRGLVARRDGVVWKYVELAVGDVDRELYDVSADPHEIVNVATDPTRAPLLASLAARLDELTQEGP